MNGYGSASAEVPVGPEPVGDGACVAVFRAPDQEHLALFFIPKHPPRLRPARFPGLPLAAKAPFGGVVNVNVPLVPTFQRDPDVSVVQIESTLGPEHLTYTKQVQRHAVLPNQGHPRHDADHPSSAFESMGPIARGGA